MTDVLLAALKRKHVQYAIMFDHPGHLTGDNYEAAFRSGLIDGEFITTHTRWCTRRFRNGFIPFEVWTQSRDAILEARRKSNMYCAPSLGSYISEAGRENIADIRKVGTLAYASIELQTATRTHDRAYIERANAYRRSMGWDELRVESLDT